MSDLLQERYGSPRPGRRLVITAATTLVALLLGGWVIWAGWLRTGPAIQADITSFDVSDSHQARVKIEASFRDDQAHGTCLLRASAEDRTVVGELTLTSAQLRASSGQWISVRTERKATTVELLNCT